MTGDTVVLVRHGQTEWSRDHRHTGRSDVPLTERGRRQARALGEMLAGVDFDLVISSPSSRAWETMVLAGRADGAAARDELLEWDYGVYEGRRTADIRAEIPGWSVWTHAIEGGESLEQVAERTDRVIAELLNADGRSLVFAHGHLIRVLAARWLDLPPVTGRNLALDTGSVSRLGWERETRVVRRWNQPCPVGPYEPMP